jgi:hypothetical protein
MYVALNSARAYVYAVAKACDAGKTTRFDAAGAILLASENAVKVSLEAVQALGGAGYTKEWPVERLVRDAKLYDIGAGTNEIRRFLIGRELTRGMTRLPHLRQTRRRLRRQNHRQRQVRRLPGQPAPRRGAARAASPRRRSAGPRPRASATSARGKLLAPRAGRAPARSRLAVPGGRPARGLRPLRWRGARRRRHRRGRPGVGPRGDDPRQRPHGQRRRLLPDDGEEAPARPGDRRAEPVAVRLSGRQRRGEPAAPGRGLPRPRPLRPHLLQPGQYERQGHRPDRLRHGPVDRRRRLCAGHERRDRDRARGGGGEPGRHLPGRPAAGEGRHRRGDQRRRN